MSAWSISDDECARPRITLSPSRADSAGTIFAGLFGMLLGLGLLKFGNPVILDRLVETPRSIDEWRIFAWPVRIGHWGLIAAVIVGVPVVFRSCRSRPFAPAWLLALLGGWFAWQFIAAAASIDPPLTRVILIHFLSCMVCFALGHLALSRVEEPRVFWMCLAGGFIGVLGMGFEQHFGGLEETRKMILQGTDGANLPPEYLARIQSRRIFSTLVYPNALAGAILLLLPAISDLAWKAGSRWGRTGACGLFLVSLLAGISVLIWSGSKVGWLLAMAAALVVLFHSPLPKSFKLGLAGVFLLGGLIAFGFVFAKKLERGATSVAARFDYWSAAWQGFRERPLVGHGPGCFKRVYLRVKRPESEMAQLAHNDYLQQATDSGLPGFLTYLGFVAGSLTWLYRHRQSMRDPLARSVWLGLAAWAAHGMVEFGLYIPATSWCAFALWGWLLALRPFTGPS